MNLLQRTLVAVLMTGAVGLVGTAQAAGPGVEVKAKGSIDHALKQLKKMVADNGMMIMGELHQGKVLSMAGLKVQSETVFVGSPTIGKKLFTAEPGMGLVVPIRINFFVDADGQTVVSYIPPSQQLGAFENPEVREIAKMLDGKIDMMMKMLAG